MQEIMEPLETLSFKEDDVKYIKNASIGVIDNIETIDDIISQHAKGWKKSRISTVCLSALRLAIYEIMFMPDIPASVSINEAVEIVKTYDEPKTAAFANGILGKLEKPDVSGN